MYLPAQGLAKQIVVVDAAPMGLELLSLLELYDELLAVLANQQDQAIFLGDIHGCTPHLNCSHYSFFRGKAQGKTGWQSSLSLESRIMN